MLALNCVSKNVCAFHNVGMYAPHCESDDIPMVHELMDACII